MVNFAFGQPPTDCAATFEAWEGICILSPDSPLLRGSFPRATNASKQGVGVPRKL
jgi:hypothetical protein